MAKQRLKGYYGSPGASCATYSAVAAGDTGENLVELLERRPDAAHRMKFAITVFASRTGH
jgi:ribosomal protein S4